MSPIRSNGAGRLQGAQAFILPKHATYFMACYLFATQGSLTHRLQLMLRVRGLGMPRCMRNMRLISLKWGSGWGRSVVGPPPPTHDASRHPRLSASLVRESHRRSSSPQPLYRPQAGTPSHPGPLLLCQPPHSPSQPTPTRIQHACCTSPLTTPHNPTPTSTAPTHAAPTFTCAPASSRCCWWSWHPC